LKVQQAVVMMCPGKSGAASHGGPWRFTEAAVRAAAAFHKQQVLTGLRKMVVAFDHASPAQRSAVLAAPGVALNLGPLALLGAVAGAWAAARHASLQRRRLVVPGISHRIDLAAWDAAAVPTQLERAYPPMPPPPPPPLAPGLPRPPVSPPARGADGAANADGSQAAAVAAEASDETAVNAESQPPSLGGAVSDGVGSPTFGGGSDVGQLHFADDSMRSLDTEATSPFHFGSSNGTASGRRSFRGGSGLGDGLLRALPSAVRPPVPSAVSPDLAESMRQQAASMQTLADEHAHEQQAFAAAKRAAHHELARLRARHYGQDRSGSVDSHHSGHSNAPPPPRLARAAPPLFPVELAGRRDKPPVSGNPKAARAWR
jgi:hypothetical protein